MRHSAEKAAAAFPGLLIAAERIADTVIHGVHGRRRAGPGEDFWQFRPYSPGDAAHRIDWRRSAKRNRLFVRENEWAATNTLWSFVSAAPGMQFKSDFSTTTKHDRAAILALALSILATKAGERVASLGSPVTPGHSRGTLNQLAHWFESQPELPDRPGLPVGQALPKFATCVLLADFLDPIEQIRESFHAIAASDVKGHVVQVFDPVEETFPFEGRTEFVDTSSLNKIVIGKAQSLRQAYTKKLSVHRAALRDLTKSLGWSFTVHHTDQSANKMLMSLHNLISANTAGQQITPTAKMGS